MEQQMDDKINLDLDKKKVKQSLQKEEDVAILITLSTGLAIRRTKPRRVPQRYLDGSLKDALNYVISTIEKAGDSDETMLTANIQDHMKSRQYIIKMNGYNISPEDNFGKLVQKYTESEELNEGENIMRYRGVDLVVTVVQEGGK